MKAGTSIIIFLSSLFLLVGCNEKKNTYEAQSKGLPYELLLVVDDEIWDGTLKDSLEGILKGDVPGLPQQESMFRLLKLYPRHYTRMYVTMRNKLFVKLDEELNQPMLGLQYNVEAKPQIVVTLAAPDTSSLKHFISTQKQRMIDLFVYSELELEALRLKKKYSKTVDLETQQLMGYSVCVPQDIKSIKKGDRFLWASTHRIEKDLNFVIYSYPCPKNYSFTLETFVQKRDSVLKKNIPGSTPEQWMTTTKQNDTPVAQSRLIVLNGKTMQEVRGLWELRKGALGGPFVSIVQIDSVAQMVLVAEGFVYSPNSNKRDLMRTMEAALRTLRKVK